MRPTMETAAFQRTHSAKGAIAVMGTSGTIVAVPANSESSP